MAFVDRAITCVACEQPFTFTASEQELFASRGFTNEPKRCANCRAQRRASQGGDASGVGSVQREMFEVTCAGCGGIARVPFQPKGVKPVYCNTCYQQNRGY